jgi:hypothetical protein
MEDGCAKKTPNVDAAPPAQVSRKLQGDAPLFREKGTSCEENWGVIDAIQNAMMPMEMVRSSPGGSQRGCLVVDNSPRWSECGRRSQRLRRSPGSRLGRWRRISLDGRSGTNIAQLAARVRNTKQLLWSFSLRRKNGMGQNALAGWQQRSNREECSVLMALLAQLDTREGWMGPSPKEGLSLPLVCCGKGHALGLGYDRYGRVARCD